MMKVSTWKFWGTLAAVVALAGCSATPPKTGYSSADGAPKSVLWVGNSFFYYNNSMHGHVGNLLSAAKVTGVRQTSATISMMSRHISSQEGLVAIHFCQEMSLNLIHLIVRSTR
jgi:hypothetical protein